MNKIDTSGVVDPSKQQPFTAYSLQFLQESVIETVANLTLGLIGNSANPLLPYAIWGCTQSGTTYGVGAIFINLEIYYFIGGSTAGYVNTGVFVLDDNSAGAPYDPITYSDLSTASVHRVRHLKLVDQVNGTGVANLSDLIFLQNNLPRTKIINIGVWNMNSTASVLVNHGLNATKIRSVSVGILNDAATTVDDLKVGSSTMNELDGNVFAGATQLTLTRRSGGLFDSTNYNDGTMNRGYITIHYVD